MAMFSKAISKFRCEMMMQCWKFNPQDRPQFKNLVLTLNHILERESGYLDLSSSFCWRDDPEQTLPATLQVADDDDGGTKSSQEC